LFCEATANSSCCAARDLVLLGDVLGGRAHVVAVEGVPQTVLDHGVDQLERAHLGAGAQMLRVRRHAHGFLPARDHDLGIAVQDRLIAERDRAQAGAAKLVDAPGRALDRDAGRDRGLAGRVLTLAGGQDLAHDDLGNLLPSTPARFSASEIATLPSSWAGRLPNAPLNAPTAVRAAPTMTMSSFMEISCLAARPPPCGILDSLTGGCQ
jgi:hypothetical protein